MQCVSSVVPVLGTDRCPSVHDQSLLSTALFPLTTKEKVEADQRSIYVGNVSGSPGAEPFPLLCAQLGVCPKSLAWGPSAPHQSLPVPIPSVSPLPSPAWECGSASATCSSSLASVSSPDPPGSRALCGVACSLKAGQAVSWICVSKWEHSAGRVPWASGEAEAVVGRCEWGQLGPLPPVVGCGSPTHDLGAGAVVAGGLRGHSRRAGVSLQQLWAHQPGHHPL